MAKRTLIGSIVALLRADNSKLKGDLKEGQTALQSFTAKATRALRRFNRAVIAYFSIRAVLNFIKSIYDAGIALKRFEVAMSAATGSVEAGQLAIKFISNEADRLGFVFQDRVKDFKLLAAAAEGTALQGEGTVQMFKALTESSVALQLSSAETSGAILAVSQMMSKGKITAEELRLQLAERFPGAVRIMAHALGISTKELDKMLERGELNIDALEEFSVKLRDRFGEDAKKASTSFIGSVNRMSTAWFKFREFLFEDTGFGKALRFVIENLTAAMDNFRKAVKHTGGTWKVFRVNAISNIRVVAETFDWAADRIGARLADLRDHYSHMSTVLDETGADVQEYAVESTHAVESFGDRFRKIVESVKEELGLLNVEIEDTADTERRLIEELGTAPVDLRKYQEAWEVINLETEEGMNAYQIQMREQAERYLMLSDVQQEGLSDWVADSRAAAIAIFGVNLDLAAKQLAVETATEEEKAKIASSGSKAMVNNLSFAFKEMGKHSRTAFEVFKGIEIAKAIVETIEAAQGAYASLAWINPGLGIAAAAAATAAGMARVEQIRNTTPGGAASVGSVGGGPTGIPMGPTPTDIEEITEREPSTQIIIQNPTVDSEERLKDLMDKMRDFTEDLDIETGDVTTAVT